MKVTVLVKPNSKKESVEVLEDGTYTVRANASPVEGAANERVIELLAEYFRRPKRAVALLRGHHSKKKIFEIS
jgi:uncharacterized protein (TIGR00251 family)